jgi:hypothetical protein
MKPTPTRTTSTDATHDITRERAAYMLRYERAEGKIVRFHHSKTLSPHKAGYMLANLSAFISIPHAERPPVVPTPEAFTLSARLSHKYVNGWSNLDRWHYIGDARPIPTGRASRWDENGESFRRFELLEVNAGNTRPDNVKRAIMDTMQTGCRCEHDCCGHVQSYVSAVRRLDSNLYAATVRGYRNV